MKDFDREWEERESDDARAFTVRGVTFYRKRAIRLETLFQAEAAIDSDEAAADALDRQVLKFIEDRDGAHDHYRELRSREDDGLGFRHVQDLKRWLIEEETGLPTTAPSVSRNGRDSNDATSTAPSSLRAVGG